MIRTLPRPIAIPVWKVWATVYIALNLAIVLIPGLLELHEPSRATWRAVAAGRPLYDLGTDIPPFVLSPIMAPVMALAGTVGIWIWGILHVGAVLLLRSPLLIVLTLSSWGFWTAWAESNPFIFAFVAGVLAMRGNHAWALVYMALLFLMPRPVQLPLAIWLVWTMPTIRLPAAGLFIAHAVLVLVTGLGPDWIATMAGIATPSWNIGPTWWLGLAWLAIGIPLGIWLLWNRRVGWAGLAWSTYIVPHNLLMPLAEDRPALPAMVALTLVAYASLILKLM